MSAILYMVRKDVKNRIVALFRHPAKLIMYLLLAALLAFSLINVALAPTAELGETFADIRILHGAYFGILLFFMGMLVLNALQKGTTFFGMADVNLLFVSPLSPRKILAYGLAKQMGRTLLMVFFFLFYGAMLAQTFGIVWTDTLALVIGSAVALFVVQLLSLLLYNVTNGHPGRIRTAKCILYLYFAVVVGIVALEFTAGGSTLEALLAGVSSPKLEYLPLVGWIKAACFGYIDGDTGKMLLYIALTLLAAVLCIVVFVRGKVDYYEDVLQTTEQTQAQKDAIKKQGNAGMVNMPGKNKKLKVTVTGLNRGWGANAFFYRHLCEARRRSKLVFVDSTTALMVAINLGMAFFLGRVWEADGEKMASGMMLLIATLFSTYLLFFFNMAGAWSRELLKPYLYLVPESPFAKLIWAAMTTLLKPVVDGAILFTVMGIYLKASPWTALLGFLLYASMGAIYIAGDVLAERVIGKSANRGLIMMLYMLFLVLLVLPGVVVSIVLLVLFLDVAPAILLVLPAVVWNLIASAGVFYFCRNMLDNSEFINEL